MANYIIILNRVNEFCTWRNVTFMVLTSSQLKIWASSWLSRLERRHRTCARAKSPVPALKLYTILLHVRIRFTLYEWYRISTVSVCSLVLYISPPRTTLTNGDEQKKEKGWLNFKNPTMLSFLVWQERFSKTINFIIFVVLPFVLKVKITKFKFVIFVTQVNITLFVYTTIKIL